MGVSEKASPSIEIFRLGNLLTKAFNGQEGGVLGRELSMKAPPSALKGYK
jgi:hypothetical protein